MRVAATVLAMAGGLIAAPIWMGGTASATPCDSADCVPYVARNVVSGQACHSTATHYVFGLDPAGRTMLCPTLNKWTASELPLIGVRSASAPCGETKGVAQSVDGQPMSCISGQWVPEFSAVYY